MAKGIGIDLGTANILINIEGKGIVINEPSVIAINKKTNKIIAVGSEAYEMVGKAPGSISVEQPLKNGVIADFDLTEALLDNLIRRISGKSFFSKPDILICCPTNITSVEQKAIREVAQRAGGKDIYLEFEPKVAAIGAGLDIFKPTGNLIIDIGGGTTDIAVLSLGEIVVSQSIRVAGNKFDSEIASYVKKKHGLVIGKSTAEQIKINIGNVFNASDEDSMMVRGRDFTTGMPREELVTSVEIKEAMEPSIQQIIAATQEVLQQTPPELSADIIDRGVMLTGGGALIKQIDQRFANELNIPAIIAEQPLNSVADGSGILLNKLEDGK